MSVTTLSRCRVALILVIGDLLVYRSQPWARARIRESIAAYRELQELTLSYAREGKL